MPLPKIIFGENHSNLINNSVLIKLSYELKKIGYETAALEEATEKTLVDLIAKREADIKNIEESIPILDKLIEKFSQEHDMNLGENIKKFERLQEECLALKNFLLMSIVTTQARNEYYRVLQNLGFNYLMTDDEKGLAGIKNKLMDVTFATLDADNYCDDDKDVEINIFDNEYEVMRNAKMTTVLWEEATPTFAVLGLNHLKSIQQNLLACYSKEAIMKNFIFFQIYSLDIEGTIDPAAMPLATYHFEANEKNEDEIVKRVVAEIKNKAAASELYSPKLNAFQFYKNKINDVVDDPSHRTQPSLGSPRC